MYMKKLFTLWLAFVPLLSMAQSEGGQYTGSGYYRVKNKDTQRYIGIVDNRAKIDGYDINLGAFFSYKGFEEQVAFNPATICYFQYVSGDVSGLSKANLIGQKLNLYNVANVYLDINKLTDGSYMLTGTRSGVSARLTDYEPSSDEVDQKKIGTTGKYMYWYILPVNDDPGQYFGVMPDLKDGSGTYWATMYASFPYTPKAGTATKSYTVRVADGFAVVQEITEMVGVDAPVLIRCNGATPSDNRLNIPNSQTSFSKTTALKGNWYCYNHINKRTGERLDHWNMTAYDPSTMRMLGLTADGKPAFVKSDIEWLPANKAYLQVPAGSPDVLPILTEEEYVAWVVEREKDQVVLTANNKGRAYGDANPAFDYTVSGTGTLKGEPAITCEATATSPVGTYPIVISKGTVSNYKQEYHNGTLTVTKAPLTITAGSYTKKQGEAMPQFAATYSGFKNGETASVLTKQPVFHCDANEASAPGEYPITVSGAEAQNYGISYVAGKLIVTAADPVKVTAKSYSRAYGDANPTFEYIVEGAPLVGEPSITCEATATSPIGEYPIVITKGSVQNYNDSYVNGVLTVTKASLTITAGSYTKKQGEAMPTFEVTYSGFKNGETASVLTKQPVIHCDANETSAPGEYPITVSGAEAQNYGISYVAGKLTVTAADPVKVTAKSYSRMYGDENPTFEYDVEGATLVGEPSITCEATATSPVGEYPIVITKGSVQNYNDTYVNGVLTITKAPLTAKVGDYKRQEGEENPEFVVSYSGFRNGDTESVLLQPAIATTEATKDSPAGTYDIVVSGGEAHDYELFYENGTLTVIESSGIAAVMADGQPVNVYSLSGNLVRAKATTLADLPKGVYLVNGHKVVVK